MKCTWMQGRSQVGSPPDDGGIEEAPLTFMLMLYKNLMKKLKSHIIIVL